MLPVKRIVSSTSKARSAFQLTIAIPLPVSVSGGGLGCHYSNAVNIGDKLPPARSCENHPRAWRILGASNRRGAYNVFPAEGANSWTSAAPVRLDLRRAQVGLAF